MALKIILGILGLIWFICGTFMSTAVLASLKDNGFDNYKEYYNCLKSIILHYILGPILMICIAITIHIEEKQKALDQDSDSDSDKADTDFKASDEYKRYII